MQDFYIKIGRNDKIVILTGAGISAESGIKTFRDSGGLWEDHNIEEVATPDAFLKNPELVMKFYAERYNSVCSAQPNAAHTALALLENEFRDNFLLITQNIDDLHQRAGCSRVIQMHGNIKKARCTRCEHVFDNFDYSKNSMFCPECNTEKKVRPHIVWFGEIPLFLDEIRQALRTCRLFLSIGTSGTVYPAAQFVDIASNAGATTVLLNLEPPENSLLFKHHLYGKASETVSLVVNKILKGVKN